MAVFATITQPNKEQINDLKRHGKKANAIAEVIHACFLPMTSKVNLLRSSVFECADGDEKPCVYQYTVTMDSSNLPTYSLYVYAHIDFITPVVFVGTYGNHGAINFETINVLDKFTAVRRELEHADAIDAYDVKFVWTYKFNPLPEGLTA